MGLVEFLFGSVSGQVAKGIEEWCKVDREMMESIRHYEEEQTKKQSRIVVKIRNGVPITIEERDFMIDSANCKSIMQMLLCESAMLEEAGK